MTVHAAEARATGFRFNVIEVDAGQVLEEFTDVTISDVTENVGRNRRGDVHIAALRHDGLGVTLALGGDGEGGELDHAVFSDRWRGGRADEVDLAHSGHASGDGEGAVDGDVTRVGNRDRSRARGHVGKRE